MKVVEKLSIFCKIVRKYAKSLKGAQIPPELCITGYKKQAKTRNNCPFQGMFGINCPKRPKQRHRGIWIVVASNKSTLLPGHSLVNYGMFYHSRPITV